MTLRRRLLTWWRGPLCDAGTVVGEGCLNSAPNETLAHPKGWTRGFRWCEEHRAEAAEEIGLTTRARLERASRKGGGR